MTLPSAPSPPPDLATRTVCMAETLIREKFEGQSAPLYLSESELAKRSVSLLGQDVPRLLQLADLTQPLFHLGFTAQVLADPDYVASNAWSLVPLLTSPQLGPFLDA